MIDFYSFAPEIFILALILVSITFGILNKGVTITINATGFSLLTIFLIFKGHSLYQDTLYSLNTCLLYTSPSPRDQRGSRMPCSA